MELIPGYSALCLAEGLINNGILHTIDINEELASFTKSFDKSKYKKSNYFHVGDALELIPKIQLQWDLVFIDADKENYSGIFLI